MLPTRDHLAELAGKVDLSLVRDFSFGLDYARTLAEWRERFRSFWERIRPMGFDERFTSGLWEFYLFYCEAGFRPAISMCARWCSGAADHSAGCGVAGW